VVGCRRRSKRQRSARTRPAQARKRRDLTVAEELRFLCGWLLPTPQARADFARRLREYLGDHRADETAIDAILGAETVSGRSA
jgi:hypothetical protein